VVKRLPSRPTNLSHLFLDSIDEMEKLLFKAKEVKRVLQSKKQELKEPG
jgi:hypothetical protein